MQELEFLSDLFTNLLVEADRVGLIEFDKSRLKSGNIVAVGGNDWMYPQSPLVPYSADVATTTYYGKSDFDVAFSIQYYDKNGKQTDPHLLYLSHAGNAISILGVHEYMLHGIKGWDGNKNHYRIYPLQWQKTKDFISPEYRSVLKKRAGL